MRIRCPLCGERDRREYYYQGDALALNRPDADTSDHEWDDYVHNRINPVGQTRDLWQHSGGCGAWLIVSRDTVSHEVFSVELAKARQEGTQ
ncbi:sarcosine oxidase subunit delta [uncultured Ruegeria sp.]|uniref:sarcosine oxidase subunit delta n=1 Tax=uncultured Ruegeria sp. TaxID=259304 RepID=UPI002618839C|nr:sarcosine oxidase subunit delta [uncultured Ruegeria sp.]